MSTSNTRLSRRAQLIRTEAKEGGTAPFVSNTLFFVFLAARNNLSVQLGVWREHAMKMNKIEPW